MRQGTEWVDIYKQPATDPAKNSKRGLLSLVRRDDGTLETICGTDQAEGNILQTVFCNGIVTKQHTLSEIRDRVNG
jgi:nicotinamide phosphoribosyltransferase